MEQDLKVLICNLKTATTQVGGRDGSDIWNIERAMGKLTFYFFVLYCLFFASLQSLPVTQTPIAYPLPPACSLSRTLAQIKASPLGRGVSAPPSLQEPTCGACSPTSSTQAG